MLPGIQVLCSPFIAISYHFHAKFTQLSFLSILRFAVWPRYRYRGCFRYVTQQQIRLLLPHTRWTMTEAAHWWEELRQPPVCVKWCVEAGYRYAGWAHNYECHCGNTLVNTGHTQCDPCFSDRRSRCGGRSQMAVYEALQGQQKHKGHLLWKELVLTKA